MTINERIAREVMGWNTEIYCKMLIRNIPGEHFEEVPDFEHSLDACAVAEAEIEKRRLWAAYLRSILLLRADASGKDWLKYLVYLGPAERCAALIKAVQP
jgi:hypothetical protein